MTSSQRDFAIDRLRSMRRAPMMWAVTREAFAMQVVLLLELLGGPTVPLLKKAFGVPHTCAAAIYKLVEPVDDDWAHAFIDDAVQWLPDWQPEEVKS